MNILETEKSYELELMAPGLQKQDFKLNVSGDILTISFDQHQNEQAENQREGWIRKEYHHKSFSRHFSMDDSIDANAIKANYENGVLQVTLPKKEQAQKISRTIEIQ